MFTGIVEELGDIQAIEKHAQGARFHIGAMLVLEGVKIGDSLSVDGCCLTVIKHKSNVWTCDVVQETLDRTTLKFLQVGDRVNLERSVRLQDRLGGHLVQGHIDETGEVLSKQLLTDGSWWVTIRPSTPFLRYAVCKGSITVDGVSLTIAGLQETSFSFAMIPHTAQNTTLGFKQAGDLVNLEADIMAKYVERFMQPFISAPLTGTFGHAQYN